MPQQHRKSGMTLVEVLAVLALIVIVTSLLSEIVMGSLRIFEQTRTEDSMRSDSELALQHMTSRLRETMTVNQVSAGMVDVYLPAKDANGNNIVDYGGMQTGLRLKFYRGDGGGAVDANGMYIWEQTQAGSALTVPNVVTTGFSNCSFQAITTVGKTTGVIITLAYSSTVMGTRTVTGSYSQEVTFRNVP